MDPRVVRIGHLLQELRGQPCTGGLGGVEQRGGHGAFALSLEKDPGQTIRLDPSSFERRLVEQVADQRPGMGQADPQGPSLGRSTPVGVLFPEVEVLVPYLIMVGVLLWRPQGLYPVANR